MSIKGQIFVILAGFFVSFICIRCFLSGIKSYQLNNNAYKKRKKGETFKEWLLYSRYKEEIPKILRVFYYFVLIVHLAGLLACLFGYIITLPLSIGRKLATAIAGFDCVWIIIIALLFWTPGPNNFAYERWITKKRGQKPNKK